MSYFVVFQVPLRAVLAVTQEHQSLGTLVCLHLREKDAQITLLKFEVYFTSSLVLCLTLVEK